MITPSTHPQYFREEAVGPFTYFVHRYHSIGLDEDIADAQTAIWREGYMEARPEELVDGKIDPAKFLAWDDEGGKVSRKVTRATAKLLFIPKGEAPAIDSDEGWYLLTGEQFASIKNFTKPKSQDSTGSPAISATNSSGNPASSNPVDAQLTS